MSDTELVPKPKREPEPERSSSARRALPKNSFEFPHLTLPFGWESSSNAAHTSRMGSPRGYQARAWLRLALAKAPRLWKYGSFGRTERSLTSATYFDISKAGYVT
jgi:hypothetical protein